MQDRGAARRKHRNDGWRLVMLVQIARKTKTQATIQLLYDACGLS